VDCDSGLKMIACLHAFISAVQITARLVGHEKSVWAVIFALDGTLIASSSNDKTVRIWSSQTLKCNFVLAQHSDFVRGISFNSKGDRLVSCSRDETIIVWDTLAGKATSVLRGHAGWVMDVKFAPDGATLASGGNDKMIRLWRGTTFEALDALHGHAGYVMSIAYSQNSVFLVSGAQDRSVRLWNIADRTQLWMATLDAPVSSVTFLLDSVQHVLVGTDSGSLQLLQKDREAPLVSRVCHSGVVWGLACAQPSSTAASVCNTLIERYTYSPLRCSGSHVAGSMLSHCPRRSSRQRLY
jgi:WD40 repeat protein